MVGANVELFSKLSNLIRYYILIFKNVNIKMNIFLSTFFNTIWIWGS